MTARDDNDEGLSSITILSTFDKVSKRMSLYEYVHVELSIELYILHLGKHNLSSDRITSCILDFYIFENFDLLFQAPGV